MYLQMLVVFTIYPQCISMSVLFWQSALSVSTYVSVFWLSAHSVSPYVPGVLTANSVSPYVSVVFTIYPQCISICQWFLTTCPLCSFDYQSVVYLHMSVAFWLPTVYLHMPVVFYYLSTLYFHMSVFFWLFIRTVSPYVSLFLTICPLCSFDYQSTVYLHMPVVFYYLSTLYFHM